MQISHNQLQWSYMLQ